jgi:opacity protein-like surface antigen
MKKLILIVLLGLVIATAGVFADHPAGWGIGVEGQYNFAWEGFEGGSGAALSLKAPQLPIFWGISLSFRDDTFGISVTGDKYITDKALIPDINLGWYLGLGGYVGLLHWSGYNMINFGARLPIGLSWRPLDFLELFLDVAPSLGLGIYFGDYVGDNFEFPEGGLGMDIGVRLWF